MRQDLRYAFRALRRSTAYAVTGIVVLGLGIGATTAIFSFVDGVLLRPLPYPEPDRLALLWEKSPAGSRNLISSDNFLDWQRGVTAFEAAAAMVASPMSFIANGEPLEVRATRVSPEYFQAFGVWPAIGRAFTIGDAEPGKDHVVVLSNRFWRQHFGSDLRVVGRGIRLDGEPYTVVGVMPAGSFDRGWPQIWRPLVLTAAERSRDYRWLRGIARLRSGVSLDQARAEMDAVGVRIARDYASSNTGWGVTVDRMADTLVDPMLRQSLGILLAAAGLLLLLACANMANLALARGTSREREVTVCAALGASRGRIVRQVIVESLLVSTAAGLVGLAWGYASMRALYTLLPPFFLPREAAVTMDWRAFTFASAVAITSGLLFGAAPAYRAGRADLDGALRARSRSASGVGGRRLRDVLVVSELAVSCLLLASASLLLRSFFEMRGVEVARDPAHILTAHLPAHDGRFADLTEARTFYGLVAARVRALPGVQSAALTTGLPLQGWPYTMSMRFLHRPSLQGNGGFKPVEPSYFQTLGVPILRGRALTEDDRRGAPPVIVVSHAFAKAYFPASDPLGERVLIHEILPGRPQLGPDIRWEIVGVVGDERVSTLGGDGAVGVYAPLAQAPVHGLYLVIRAGSDAVSLASPLQAAVHEIAPTQPVTDLETVDQLRDEFIVSDRLRTWLMAVFSGLALVLAAAGIYGVMS